MKILVLGAGATGGYFGGRLAQTGADVTFLVRPKRAEQLRESELIIEALTGRDLVKVNTVSAETVTPIYDVILLSCKAYDLDSAIDAIAGAMHQRTCVVPLLNGVSHLAVLDDALGAPRVMGGSCQIVATLTPEGVIKSMAATQAILWEPRHGNAHQPHATRTAAVRKAHPTPRSSSPPRCCATSKQATRLKPTTSSVTCSPRRVSTASTMPCSALPTRTCKPISSVASRDGRRVRRAHQPHATRTTAVREAHPTPRSSSTSPASGSINP